ncbi:MAG: VTT domain-containing protein [bacterium]
MKPSIYKTSLKFLILALVLVLFLYIFSTLQNVFLKYVSLLSDFLVAHKIIGALIFIATAIVAVLISPFSNLPLVPSAVAAWGNFPTFIFLIVGWVLGGLLAYGLGGYAGEKIFRRFLNFEKVDYYKNKISPRTQFELVLLFRFAIPSEIAGYTLGIIRYDFKKYMIATFLTEVPFAFISLYLSQILVQGKFLVFAVILSLVAALITLASYIFHKKI